MKKKTIDFLADACFSEPKRIRGMVVLPLVAGLKDLISVIEIKIALDLILEQHSLEKLILFVVSMRLLSFVLSYIECQYQWNLVPVANSQIRKKCNQKVARWVSGLPLLEIGDSDMLNKVERSVVALGDRTGAILDSICTLIGGLIRLVLICVFVGSIDWTLIVLAFLSALISGMMNSRSAAINRKKTEEVTFDKRKAEYFNRLFLMPEYAYDIKHRSDEGYLLKEVDKNFSNIVCKQDAYNKKKAFVNVVKEFQLYFLVYGVGALVLFTRYQAGIVGISAVTAALFGAVRIANAAEEVSFFWSKLLEEAPFLEEGLDLIDNFQIQGPDTERKQADGDVGGKIEFKHVGFSYTENIPVLKDISFSIEKGEKIALVGENGAGKTTIVRMLLGLIEPREGEARIDGRLISEYSRGALQEIIGAGLQKNGIFSFTLAQNVMVTYAPDSSERHHLMEVLRSVELTEAVNRLPAGEDTFLGTEMGEPNSGLSGGQSERLCVARAVCRNQPILVLDEPSANLDAFAEEKLFRDMMKVGKDKTMIFITHQLAFTRDVDRILLVKDGVISECGSHDELMSKGGEYASMFLTQKGLYTGE
ncbi:MAG: ABC transporter ATP-binding protein [Lachnospiraceae bacterium]|nr:ABC transporter ATP-binding protein [Lachnospiraceae bacterium]